MALLSKNQILESKDFVTEIVEVPEWGGEVMIRSVTALQRDRFESLVDRYNDGDKNAFLNFRASFVANSICDEDGSLLFTEQDIRKLGDKSAAVVDRIFTKARKLSGMGKDEAENEEIVAAAEKN